MLELKVKNFIKKNCKNLLKFKKLIKILNF